MDIIKTLKKHSLKLLVFTTPLVINTRVYACGDNDSNTPCTTIQGDITPLTPVTITELVTSISNLLAPIVLLVFLGIIIYGGFVRMTAAGDSDKVESSTKIITAGIVGFIIIALAPLIINLVGTFIGIPRLIE